MFVGTLLVVLVAALIARLAFFRGAFGSDDVIYMTRALEVASGIWTSADYNGALRYGFNIPAGFFIKHFGPNIYAANLFSLLCSLGEIIVVSLFAKSLWGARAGIIAALLIAFIPWHIGAASAIHTDPIVAFFITLSFILFWQAEKRQLSLLYFATGLTMGFVFWVKELIIIYLVVFAFYALIEWRFDRKWLYIVGGGLVFLIGHLLLFWAVSGDPFHGFKTYFMQIDRDFVGRAKESGPLYYFYYLFLNIRHSWVVPFLTIGGMILIWRNKAGSLSSSDRFILVWLLGMLAVFSFTPLSLSPLQFITKQSNYLNLFFAPLALVAARFLAALSAKIVLPILAISIVGGLSLAALGQQDLRKFVSNSKAAATFARENPDAQIFGSVNNRNIFAILMLGRPGNGSQISSLESLTADDRTPDSDVFVVLDRETRGWGPGDRTPQSPLACWKPVKRLVPEGFGAGLWVTNAFITIAQLAPTPISTRVSAPLQNLLKPKPADLYLVSLADPWCTSTH